MAVVQPSEVLEQMATGALLLTASQALAVDWKRRLIAISAADVCETPAVMAWQAWLSGLAEGLDTMPVALNRVQEGWLWQQVIGADLPDQSAASVRGLAGHASEAYALKQEYQIDVAELSLAGEETDALLRWIDGLHQRLAGGALADRILAADVGQRVSKSLTAVEKQKSILLAGFDAFTPLQKQLLLALQASGVQVLQIETESYSVVNRLYACADVQEECGHIAARSLALLTENPHARIAIVTSDAVNDVSLLRRTLNDVLMPELRCDPSNRMNAVSMDGDMLTDSPMIRQLLHVLSLAGEYSFSFDTFAILLFSPWLKGYEAERLGRAELDAKFRQQNRHRLLFKSLLGSSYVKALPALLSVLQALAGWNKHKRSANDWVKAVHELLKVVGFVQLASSKADSSLSDLVESNKSDDSNKSDKSEPDQAGSPDVLQRSDQEIRQMNAFRDVLVSLVAVDAVGVDHKLPWAQFLSLLRTACSEIRLAEMAKYANVTVLPLSQMKGLQFDHVLLMGFDEEAFPPPARPYALLPASVQKKYALPMSHAALVYESSALLWKSLLQSAANIEISYAKQRDDKELLASSFVTDMVPSPCERLSMDTSKLSMEVFDDVSAVPLQDGQQVSGGTSIVRNQSACPFRAFATHRLGIAALGETTPGIEASSKGSLIHLALEYIWRTLKSQQVLRALDHNAAINLIAAAIDHAWDKAYVVADSRTRGFEKKRMQRVLLEWFELELDRPAFKVVGIEQEYLMQLPMYLPMKSDSSSDHAREQSIEQPAEQQFVVKIKADRMDVDASGRRLLIDYKTGAKQSTRTWLVSENNERIEEPQLPQYALAAGLGADDAVAFARVRSGDMSFEGLCGDDIGIKGIVACDGKRRAPDDWQDVLDDWKTYINMLAGEFVDGRCDVSPRDAGACKYCGFEAICRIEEIGRIEGTGQIEGSGQIEEVGGADAGHGKNNRGGGER